MREKPTYRDHLEDILRFTGGARLLAVSQTAEYLGRSREWVSKRLKRENGGVSAVTLARWLA